MTELEDLIARLRREGQTPSATITGTWRRYDDMVNSMSNEQKLWVCKQESVLAKKSLMYSDFIDYLFGLHRDAFASVNEGKYKKVCDEYIDELHKASASYVSHAEQLEKQNENLMEENKKLQMKLEEILQGNKYESNAADRSRQSRVKNTELPVRAGDDSQRSLFDTELSEDKSE